jgi:hypothetical protein
MLSQLQTMNLLIILQTDSSPNSFLLAPHATPKTLIHQCSQSLPSHHQWQKLRRRRESRDISSSSSITAAGSAKCNADFDDDYCGKHESSSTSTRSLLLPLRHGYFPLLYVCFSQATPACCCFCCCCCTPTPLFFV